MENLSEFFASLARGSCRSWEGRPEVLETHISQVFLLSDVVFKFKKPIVLSFLDYGSREKRFKACWAEYHLGRRFGGEIYRRVVHVRQKGPEILEMDEVSPEDPVRIEGEYAVEMRRLPQEKLLDHILQTAQVSHPMIQEIIRHFAMTCVIRPTQLMAPEEYSRRVYQHIDENRSTGEMILKEDQGLSRLWARLSGLLLLGCVRRKKILEERVSGGKIIHGHGDLRPEHVYLGGQVAFIDAVEFSEDFRTLDQVDELCFLAMECRFLGSNETATSLLLEGCRELHDDPGEPLLRFYEAYRAMVRAKVAFLRSNQLSICDKAAASRFSNQGERYLRLALRLLTEGATKEFDKPMVFLVAGSMGSGKSTIARELAQRCGCILLQTDVIRKEIFVGEDSTQLKYGEGKYRLDSRCRVYDSMFCKMDDWLKKGFSVVLDGSFGDSRIVEKVTGHLKGIGVPYSVLLCQVPDHIALARIENRLKSGLDPSEARPDLLQIQKEIGNWDFSEHPCVRIDGDQATDKNIEKIVNFLNDVRP